MKGKPRHRQTTRELLKPAQLVGFVIKTGSPQHNPIRRNRHLQRSRTSVPYCPDHLPRLLMIPACRKYHGHFGHGYNRHPPAENRAMQPASGQRTVNGLERRPLGQEIPHWPARADAPENDCAQNTGHPGRNGIRRHLFQTAYMGII